MNRLQKKSKGKSKNFQKQIKINHDNSKPMKCRKISSKRKFIAIQTNLKKQEKHQTDNLTLHLKPLEKGEEQQPKNKNPKLV